MSLPPFSQILDAHGDEVFSHVRRLSPDGAEDVFQEALLRALRSYDRLAHDNHLRAWLYRVATTTAYDHNSRAHRAREVLVDNVPEQPAADVDVDQAFQALIDRLPDGARAALTMRFYDDLGYDEMARRLGCSEEAARQRVSSAVRRLRKEF